MSFDVFLQCVAGDPLGVPRAAVRALFPIMEEGSEPDCWHVRYGPADWCEIQVTEAKSNHELITSLSVNRPCGDIRFWESVLAILKMGPVILYWMGGGPLVGSQATADKFPEETAESLGQPSCVRSAQEILDAIHQS